jgi:lipoprotein-anchoring transpeptidase ErfK/SrfK
MRFLGRWLLRLFAVPAAAAVVCAAAPAAGSPPARIPAAVTVNGLWIGGLTTEAARAKLHTGFDRPLRFREGPRKWSERASSFADAVAVNDVITAALASEPNRDVRVRVGARKDVVDRYVRKLDRRYSRPARDARFIGLTSALSPAFSATANGRRLDAAKLKAAIARALDSPQRNRIVLTYRPVPPKVTAATYGPIVVIRRESKVLTLYDGPRFVRQMPVATGTSEFPTPLGSFEIVDKQYDPWWNPPASDWAKGLKPVPPGPGNPLGTRWMGLNVYGVGIHGTPDAASIGYSASHGCIRMQIPDAEWLFEQVPHGTPVVIISA